MTVDEIVKAVGKPREVLARLLKHIAAMGYIEETGSDEYAPTNFSKALTIPIIGDGYPCLAGGAHRSCSHFPTFMEKTEYAIPNDPDAGPYQDAFETKMNMFQYMMANPPLGMQFNHHMGGYRQGRPSWMDAGFYPVEERLIAGVDKSQDAALLVDIGGSLGHDVAEFRYVAIYLTSTWILTCYPGRNTRTHLGSLCCRISRRSSTVSSNWTRRLSA